MCHLAEQLEDFLLLGFYAYHFEKCTKNQIIIFLMCMYS